ncbi:HIT family protein [Aureispira anguillae]|uniref:HIT domain-containing protein n=1 Tax=Aureispira anguillae TaxID=2864201 RepID=A0A915YMC0_9BACT|nr:HIT domain-containing protein [Aureispira anguillae]BDS15438.1 HIT domain-containing protein [Aureispira anguillae]
MASIFTRIVNGEIPCHKIAENEHFLAFLDIAPVAKGHTLVIPKKEVDYIFDLEEELYIGLHLFAKRVASAIEKTIHCERIGQTVLGLEVPHAHIHLVPLLNMQFIDFNKRQSMEQDAFSALAAKIQANFV